MKTEIKILKVAQLEQNRGQLEGLPENPRYSTKEDKEALKKSIQDNPEMLSLRELLVYPLSKDDARYIVIGGNMRLEALKELGYEDAPCKIIPENEFHLLKSRVIKDNAPFGEWDYDMLANEWDEEELKGFGLDISGWKVSEQDFDDASQEIDVDLFDEEMKLKVRMTDEQMEYVKERLSEINSSPEMALLIACGWNDDY